MAITAKQTLTVASDAFENEGTIPKKYSCEGENINPSLSITDIPKEAKTLALIMEDPDAPGGTFVHWVCWNIAPNNPIAENSSPGIDGVNSVGKTGYMGPCPPKGSHRYYFKIFALNDKLELSPSADKDELLLAMKDHIIATGQIMGHYQKDK